MCSRLSALGLQSVPGGTSFFRPIPRPFFLAAFLLSRYRSAAIWSGRLCCSTLDESPEALAGAWAFSRMVCSRSSAHSSRFPFRSARVVFRAMAWATEPSAPLDLVVNIQL